MVVNPVAENVLGTMGTLMWCIQLIPQIWKSWREKSTAGLSQFLVLLWGFAGLPLGVYALLQNLAIPLIVQPQLFAFLALFSWGQCLHYDKGFSTWKAVLIAGTVMAIEGGLEAGIYFARKEVVGISIPFIIVDLLGGVFSLLSLVFRPKFDALAGVAYSLVVVMDGLVVIAAMVLNPIASRRRRREAVEHREVTPPRSRMMESRTLTESSTLGSSSAAHTMDCKLMTDPEKVLATIEEPHCPPSELGPVKGEGTGPSRYA